MRGLIFLLAATAAAQDNRGFVNQGLVNRRIFANALKPKPLVLNDTIPAPPPGPCAIPLLEVPVRKNFDRDMVITPGKWVDRMILPTVPVCGK